MSAFVGGVLAAPSTSASQTPTASARSQLRAVRLRPSADSIQVIFVIDGPVRYVSRRASEPPTITIDISRTTINPVLAKREILSVHAALIRVRILRSEGGARAILDLAEAGSYSVYYAPKSGQLVVDIKTRPREAIARKEPAPAPLRTVPPSPRNAVPPVVEPRASALDVELQSATVHVPWIARRPEIDDFIQSGWRDAAARVTGFRQREPGDGNPVSEDTTAYLSYDSEHLYAVFVCSDGTGKVRDHLMPREDISGDDQVTVYLDTFRDGRHAYVFASNPSGVQQDGVIDEGADTNLDADSLWYSKGRRTSDGFVVLMAIPFKSLRFPNGAAQRWRIALGRMISRQRESAFWPYITRQVNGFVRQMGDMEGLELVSPGHNVQLTPYGTFTRSQSLDLGDLSELMAEDRRGGLDAKVVLGTAVTVDDGACCAWSAVAESRPTKTVETRVMKGASKSS